jgi:colanic acid/amylovoran biosynthesis glycosyltransferase
MRLLSVLGSAKRLIMPTVVFYCQDYLKSDMLHIYRQVESLPTWRSAVVCQKRENQDKFWISKNRLSVLPKDRWRWLRRQYFKRIARGPVQISPSQTVRLLKEVYRYHADVVHIFFGHIAVALLPFIKACPLPLVVSFHGADAGVDMNKPVHAQALREVFAKADRVFARSEALLENLAELGCPREKLQLQRTGVPLDEWTFVPREVPASGAWHLLQACRLVEKKGLYTTLKVFQAVQQKFPQARLTLVGDGPLLEPLRAKVASLGLADAVSFPGFLNQKQLRALAQTCHIFLHPSETPADGNREGVPNSMLEAMASGMPILATEHGGIPEAVTHGVSGFLVAEGDAAALAEHALQLVGDDELYRRMAQAARAEVAQKFDRKRVSEALEAAYEEIRQPWGIAHSSLPEEIDEDI